MCPELNLLEQAALGLLSDDDLAPLEEHLTKCERCLDAVLKNSSSDTIMEALRESPRAAERRAAVQGDIDRLKAAFAASLPQWFSQAPATIPAAEVLDKLQLDDTSPPASELGTDTPAAYEAMPDDEERYDFLSPAQSPGELGRLGNYRVLRILGTGGMGVVFEAEDLQLERRVALKAMKPSVASPPARKRFIREAKTAASVEHDNIVPVYQVGEDRGVPFIAMPLLRGETLADRLKRAATLHTEIEGVKATIALPVSEVLRIGREVALGLEAAHRQGLIHRDIKPSNIWLEAETGRAKILDFGLARANGSDEQLTQAGAMLGTPAYMSPEQASGSDLEATSDLFSLGCVLYHMATGRRPFIGRDALATLVAVTTTEPPQPGELNFELPRELNDLIVALLSKAPATRPQPATEIVARIREIESQLHDRRGVKVHHGAAAGLAPRERKTKRREWLATSALPWGAAAVLLCGVMIVIKYKDGTTRTIKDDQPVESVTVKEVAIGGSTASPIIEPQAGAPGHAPPPTIPAGQRLAPLAWVTRPAKLPGVKSWTIESAAPTSSNWGDSLAANPDGTSIAFGSADGRVRIWELATGRLKKVLLGPGRNRINCIAWSSDGKWLAAAHHPFDRVYIWDVPKGAVAATVNFGPGEIRALAWSQDSRTLAAARNDIQCWDCASGNLLESFGKGASIIAAAWSPADRLLATRSDSKVRIWRPDSGELIRELDAADDDPPMASLAWSGDGKTLACQDGRSGQLKLWNAETGELLPPFKEFTALQLNAGVAWSPNSKQLAVATGRVSLWDFETGKQDGILPVTADFHGSGSLTWCGSNSVVAAPEAGHVHVWNARTHKLERTIAGLPGRLITAWSPADRSLAVSCYRGVWFWDGKSQMAASLATDSRLRPSARLLAWSPQGDRVFRGIYGTSESALISKRGNTWAAQTLPIKVYDGAISPDGSLLAVSPVDAEYKGNRLELWDLDRSRFLREFEQYPSRIFNGGSSHGANKKRVAWSPDQKEIACCADNGTVSVWSVQSGSLLRTLDSFEAEAADVQWSPDGTRLAVGGHTSRVWICEPAGRILHVLPFELANGDPAVWLTWSADGRTLQATSGLGMRQWDAATGRKIGQSGSPFTDLSGGSTASVSADGKLAVASAADEVARIWDTRTSEHVSTLIPFGSGGLAAISPEGHYRALSDTAEIDEQIVYLVETDAGQQILTPKEFATKYDWKNEPEQCQFKIEDAPVPALAVATAAQAPEPLRQPPLPPAHIAAGDRLAPLALVTRPAKLPGVKSWTVETTNPTSINAAACSTAVSPGGEFVAFGATDGRVRVWELATGRLVKVFLGTASRVSTVAWSPDGRLLAVGPFSGNGVNVWEFHSGRRIADLPIDGEVMGLTWSPDSSTLAIAHFISAGESIIKRWDRATGQMLAPFSQGAIITAVAWSPVSNLLASRDTSNIKIWDGDTGQLIKEFGEPGDLNAATLAWSPDGKLLSVKALGRNPQVWEVRTGALRQSIAEPFHPASAAWSVDGKQLAILAPSAVEIWNVESCMRQSTLAYPGPTQLASLAWSNPDGQIVAAGVEGPICVWDTRSLKLERALGELTGQLLTAWSPTDRTLAVASCGRVWFWDGKGGSTAHDAPADPLLGYVNDITWSPRADWVFCSRVSEGGSAVLSKMGDGEWRVAALPINAIIGAISPDGSQVVAGRWDSEGKFNTLELWDVVRRKFIREFEPFPSRLFVFGSFGQGIRKNYVSWSPDSKRIACAAENGSIGIWEPESGGLLSILGDFKTPYGSPHSISWSPDGRRLAVGGEGNIVWICEPSDESKQNLAFERLGLHEPLHLTWSPDGKTLQATGNWGMRRWDAATGKKVAQNDNPFKGLWGSSSAAITADGRLAVAAGHDEVARIWDTETGDHLLTLVPLARGGLAGVSADGHYRALSDTPDIDEQFCYVVETDAGQQTLRPHEFAEKYGWNNEPEKVSLPR